MIRKLGVVIPLLALLAAPALAQITAVRIAQGIVFPVYATTPPEDATRLFVLEQFGRIRLVKNDTLLPTPFLDITSVVNPSGEQGLLGLAFHPDYATNGWFFIYYIEGTGPGSSTIWRYSVSANPDSADQNSGVRIFTLTQPFENHNGGTLQFGPDDDYLYVGLGDGGASGDPANRSQNGLDLLGKMLRIDVDGVDDFPLDDNNNYAIPPDNPFVGNALVNDEIWAYGLRNPFRWSFDRLTGDFWIGDVGQDCFEEISFHPGSVGGENYGWDVMEGPDCYNEMQFSCNDGPCGAGLVDPVHWLAHPGGSVSVVGGYRYRGTAIPILEGEYLFGEYYTGSIIGLRFDGTAVTDTTDWTSILDPLGTNINLVAGICEDANGELYIVDTDGDIFRIERDPVDVVPIGPSRSRLAIGPASPNPFRITTRFRVVTDPHANLEVSVYAPGGRLVRRLHQGQVQNGEIALEWRAWRDGVNDLPAGVYFIRAQSHGGVASTRVVLLK